MAEEIENSLFWFGLVVVMDVCVCVCILKSFPRKRSKVKMTSPLL